MLEYCLFWAETVFVQVRTHIEYMFPCSKSLRETVVHLKFCPTPARQHHYAHCRRYV